MRNAPKLLLALVALAFLGIVMAYIAGVFHAKVEKVPGEPYDVDGEAVVARLTETPVTAPVPGTVNPTDETLIGSRLLAAVTRVHVRAGDSVAQGDLLVELDDVALQAALKQREQAADGADAALEEATRNRDRAVQLYEQGSLSRADYDRAMTNHRVATAEAERAAQAADEARTQLSFTRITAPIDGRVVERLIEPGDTAMPGQPLLKLFNPGRMRVEAILRESLIRYVEPGSTLTAHIDALSLSLDSVVEEIVPTADPGSRTFTIKSLLPAVPDLYPGMFARLDIPTGTRERLLVPAAAVQRSGQLRFVYVRAGDVVQRRFVRVGETYPGGVELVSGVNPNELVIVPPAPG